MRWRRAWPRFLRQMIEAVEVLGRGRSLAFVAAEAGLVCVHVFSICE